MNAMFAWTRARIAAAEAMEMPVDRGLGGIDTPALVDPRVVGPEQSTPAGAAAPGALGVARAVYAEDWAALEKSLTLDEQQALEDALLMDAPADAQTGTAGVYTSYDVNRHTALWRVYPHIWQGKLTFVNASGVDSSCSATVISGNNIVTAAHCVYDTSVNQFHTSKAFNACLPQRQRALWDLPDGGVHHSKGVCKPVGLVHHRQVGTP